MLLRSDSVNTRIQTIGDTTQTFFEITTPKSVARSTHPPIGAMLVTQSSTSQPSVDYTTWGLPQFSPGPGLYGIIT